MKIQYDIEADAMHIVLAKAKVQESDEVDSGIILDYNRSGKVVGIEILDVSKRGAKNRRKKKLRSQDFAFCGMNRGDKRSIEEVMDDLRGGRFRNF